MSIDATKLVVDSGTLTTVPLSEAAAKASQIHQPEFLRLPPPGLKCPASGLSRSYLNLLVLPCPQNDFKPPVRSFVLRRPGARTGVRLIDRASLFAYIRAHEQRGGAQSPETQDAA